MFGHATLDIPQSGNIGPSRTTGLSDAMATTMGRAAALTLSKHDGCVVVRLESGGFKNISYDAINYRMIMSHHARQSYRIF